MSGIKLKIHGFDELLKDIEAAGRSIDGAVDSTMRQSAKTVESELKTQMQAAGVAPDLVSRMPPTITSKTGNYIACKVGYIKGAYDPKDPSDGYKVVFLNYGTPNRSKHGKVKARGFIQKAKKKVTPVLKKQQEATFKKILARLKK